MSIKLISWNVNGIRAILKKGMFQAVLEHQPDFICLQETKAEKEQVTDLQIPGYLEYWNSAERKGYSGTAIFTRHPPLSIFLGMGESQHDTEGRIVTLEYERVYIISVYTPNSGEALARLSYRAQEWDQAFLAYIKKLAQKKHVILGGDLNVAHKEIDLARPKENMKTAGFTNEERMGFDNIVSSGFVDTFRLFNQEPGQYTWWSYRTKGRERNMGWRIDYFCVSSGCVPFIKGASILNNIQGSDHCPVLLEVDKAVLQA